MRRVYAMASVLAVTLCLFFVGGMPVSAEGVSTDTPQDVTQEAAGWWESLRGALPEDIAEEIRGIENGDTEMGFEYLFGLVLRELRGESGGFIKCLATLLGITVLGGLAGLLTEEHEGLKKPVGMVLSVAVTLSLLGVVSSTLTRAEGYLSDLADFAGGLTPVFAAVLAGGGAAGGAAVTATALTTLISVLEIVVGRVLAPLIAVTLAFTLIGGISDGLHIDGIAANLRGIYMTVLGVVGMVATGAVTLQGVIASAGDSMAMRTARYTVGNMIPLVGGTIGAALGTLGSSLTVIKSSIGVGALVACLLLTLPLLLSLYFTRLSLGISASVARMMGFRTGERILNDFRGVFDMTLAVTALAGTLFLIYIAVFLKTALPFAA